MSDVTFSGRQPKNNAQGGKHHKPPIVIRPWHVASGAVAVTAIIALTVTGIVFRTTAPGPLAAPKLAYQSGASAATDNYVDQQARAEDAAIAQDEQLWISHIRELSQAQRTEIAKRQALADEEARQAAEAEARKQAAAAQTAAQTASASMVATNILLVGDQSQARAIDIYLTEQDSPMVGYGRAFISAGKIFNVDPFLVVAIAGKESSWGKHCFLPYNAWGWGEVSFTDRENAIFNYTRMFSEEYTSKGPTDINVIAPIYCPPNYAAWARDVTALYGEIVAIQVGLNR